MRLIICFMILLPLHSFTQDTSLKKIFPIKDGKVYYETAFLLEIPNDTLFARVKKWITAQKGYQNDLYFTRIYNLKTSIEQQYVKCRISFSQPFSSNNKQKADLKELRYLYTLRVYINNLHKIQIIIDNVCLTGNLADIGVSLNKSMKDTIYVEDYQIVQNSLPNPSQQRTAVYNNYKKADGYLKNKTKEIIAAIYNKPYSVEPETTYSQKN